MLDQITITVNGRPVQVWKGTSVAAALLVAGEYAFRHSVTSEPRGPLCGMGICFECRVTIDGHPQSRSCQLSVREGMAIETA